MYLCREGLIMCFGCLDKIHIMSHHCMHLTHVLGKNGLKII